jgi:acetamidase/formamidase
LCWRCHLITLFQFLYYETNRLQIFETHYLSGPLRVVDSEGISASPGDLLGIEICNLGPLPGDEWGYTAIFERENGGGFLTDHFLSARKAIWYFEGICAYSQIPGKKVLVIHGDEALQFCVFQ